MIYMYPALLLDLLFGDPRVAFHPVRLIGALAKRCERSARPAGSDGPADRQRVVDRKRVAGARASAQAGRRAVLAGGVAWACVAGTVAATAVFALILALFLHPLAALAAGSIALASSVAVRDLGAHGRRVLAAVENDDVHQARTQVGMMVSRETSGLTREGAIRATVESVAENLSDGVVAPLFYALILGPAGALLYRAINTLDAMWGYRNERYEYFGRVAARADDAANAVPARLTAILIVIFCPVVGGSPRRAWRVVSRDARLSRSPNAGFPEAAAAGATGVRLGGSATYFGEVREQPSLGSEFREAKVADLRKVLTLALAVSYGPPLAALLSSTVTAAITGGTLFPTIAEGALLFGLAGVLLG